MNTTYVTTRCPSCNELMAFNRPASVYRLLPGTCSVCGRMPIKYEFSHDYRHF